MVVGKTSMSTTIVDTTIPAGECGKISTEASIEMAVVYSVVIPQHS